MIGERLKQIRQELGFSQTEFSRATGIPQTSLSQYETKNSIPSDVIERIANVIKLNIEWFITGQGKMFLDKGESNTFNEDVMQFVQVPILSAKASAGYGMENYDVEIIGKMPIMRKFLILCPINRVRIIQVDGESMRPFLNPGDYVVFCEGYRAGDGIYIINRKGELFIKRLYFLIGKGNIIVHSDNPDYPREELTPEQQEDLIIVGKMIVKIQQIGG